MAREMHGVDSVTPRDSRDLAVSNLLVDAQVDPVFSVG